MCAMPGLLSRPPLPCPAPPRPAKPCPAALCPAAPCTAAPRSAPCSPDDYYDEEEDAVASAPPAAPAAPAPLAAPAAPTAPVVPVVPVAPAGRPPFKIPPPPAGMPPMPPMPAGAPPVSTPLAGASSSAAPHVSPVPNSDSQYDYYYEEEGEEELALAVAPIGAAPAPADDNCAPSCPGCGRAPEALTLTQHAACSSTHRTAMHLPASLNPALTLPLASVRFLAADEYEYYDGETVTETSGQKKDLLAQFRALPKTPK